MLASPQVAHSFINLNLNLANGYTITEQTLHPCSLVQPSAPQLGNHLYN